MIKKEDMFKFISWLAVEVTLKVRWSDAERAYIKHWIFRDRTMQWVDQPVSEEKTLPELYDYWCENIRDN